MAASTVIGARQDLDGAAEPKSRMLRSRRVSVKMTPGAADAILAGGGGGGGGGGGDGDDVSDLWAPPPKDSSEARIRELEAKLKRMQEAAEEDREKLRRAARTGRGVERQVEELSDAGAGGRPRPATTRRRRRKKDNGVFGYLFGEDKAIKVKKRRKRRGGSTERV